MLALSWLGCSGAPPPCPDPNDKLALATAPRPGYGLLDPLVERAEQAGARQITVIADGVGSEGDRTGGYIKLPSKSCVVVFARASKGVGDLDLFVYADDGTIVATDESSSAEAAVVLCPPVPERVYVAARIANGGGSLSVGAAEVEPGAAPRVASALGARTQGQESGRLESWPGLEAKVAAHRKALGSSWEDVRRFATLVDPRAATRSSITIDPGRCIDVMVVPSEEVPSLEVVAEEKGGRIVARAASEGRDRTLVLCSDAGDEITIAARPRGGAGLAAFVIGRSPKRAASEIAHKTRIEHLSQSETAETARTLLAKQVDLSWGKGNPAGAGEARLGSRTTLDLRLAEGCSRLDVVAGHPLGPLTAALWDGAALLAESSGSARATLYACGPKRALRLDVESGGRPGPFVVDARTVSGQSADVQKRPLAAARVLDRFIGSSDDPPTLLGDARAVELDSARMLSSSFVVPQSSCTEVVVALESGAGVEVRIVDEASGDDVIGRGLSVASQRLCGNKSSRRAKLEVRVDKGPAPALIAFQTSKD